VNIRAERRDLLESDTDHFNIEKNKRIHEEVVRKLKEHCPPRQAWVTQRQALRYSAAVKGHAVTAGPGTSTNGVGASRLAPGDPHLDRVP
jgi:hypothetical protein